MLPAYKPTHWHGAYVARGTRYPVAALRPSRNAAGMAYTASRGGGAMSDEARRLSIWGTLDRSRGLRGLFMASVKPCPCCKAKTGKLILSDKGRARLKLLRSRRQ